MSKTENLRFEANIPKVKDRQLQRTFIDLSRDLKAISDKSKVIDGGRIGMMYTTAEDATKWPVIDGVHQKNGYALCDGKTLSSRSNKYSKFNEATGGLKLPIGYMRSNTIDLPTLILPSGWDGGDGAGVKGYAEVDSSGQWYLDVTITQEISPTLSTYIELDGVRHTGIEDDYQALAQNDSGSISGVIAGAYAHWGYPRIYNTFSSANSVFWVSGKYRILDMPDWFADNNESWPIIQITEDAYEMGSAITNDVRSLTSAPPAGFNSGGTGDFIPYSHLLAKNDMWGNAYYYGLKDAIYDLGGLIHNGSFRVALQSNGYRNIVGYLEKAMRLLTYLVLLLLRLVLMVISYLIQSYRN